MHKSEKLQLNDIASNIKIEIVSKKVSLLGNLFIFSFIKIIYKKVENDFLCVKVILRNKSSDDMFLIWKQKWI